MSASRFENSKMTQLDRKAEARQIITPEDVQDPERLARILNELRESADEERRRFKPSWVDFANIAVVASTTYRFEHRLAGRVKWWIADWQPTNVGANPYAEFFRVATSTDNVLVLLTSSVTAGTCTVHIEEAG
jgi:hypothetical protein